MTVFCSDMSFVTLLISCCSSKSPERFLVIIVSAKTVAATAVRHKTKGISFVINMLCGPLFKDIR